MSTSNTLPGAVVSRVVTACRCDGKDGLLGRTRNAWHPATKMTKRVINCLMIIRLLAFAGTRFRCFLVLLSALRVEGDGGMGITGRR